MLKVCTFLSVLFKVIKGMLKYSPGSVTVAGTHKLILEVLHSLFIKAGVDILDIVNHFKIGLAYRTRSDFVIIVVETSPVEILVDIVSKEDKRLFEKRILKYKR